MKNNWKTFTHDELKKIRENPYVKSATDKMIFFTVEFKEEFWKRYNDNYQSPVRIMEELGFDVDVLGQRRIVGILCHIRDQVNSGEEFRDVRKIPKSQAKNDNQPLAPSKAMLKMQHKIAYLEQEVEFIKKTIIAGNEARRRK